MATRQGMRQDGIGNLRGWLLGVTFFTSGLCFAGCASESASVTRIGGTVNSIKAHGIDCGNRVVVLPGDKATSPQDLQFREYSEYLRRSLTAKGFVWSESKEQADVLVLLDYGIGDPKEHTETRAVPVFGQTGISSSYTSGSVNRFGGYSGTTTYQPSYGIVGAVPVTKNHTTYTRCIRLVAYDCKTYMSRGQEVMLWSTDIVSTGFSGDLRRVFPAMIAASQAYIGEDTGQAVPFAIEEKDPRISALKGIGNAQQ